ncbi:anthranilate phosphoribosyltransferase [Thiothrix eikelboomii]|uniref:Anthranilate phosphoribosyltransferase n=1 Tax=Thiothrix eikelboomii TaxID=92487 RepID=A0A1T4WN01_9GAMM|nr:anthranilate phosphoribosyltransferase [Thiothrix eikelboomii]SKA78740.1 anthranilate phosphoribosyltransferase [Thiothrix eikelboomii]
MDFQQYIRKISDHQLLSHTEMTEAMRIIMTGQATPAQVGAFLLGLRMRGETVEEITAAASVMRELATPVAINHEYLVDTCGTGGDSSGTFNISTASAFVAAAAGARVAKHGNRSVSSKSGSADVLETAGINLELTADQVARCINELGVGFLFAQKHHNAMKHAIGPRRELGIRTVFNLLGPLTNPAGAPNQVLGVFAKAWVRPIAEVLQKLGSRHVLVVHSADGLDEISIAAPTYVAEMKEGVVREYILNPEDLGLRTACLDELKVPTSADSLAMIRHALSNQPSAASDIVALNAGAAIYVAGLATSHADGVKQAQAVMADGSALARLQQLAHFSQQFQPAS